MPQTDFFRLFTDRAQIEGHDVWIAPPEYVILGKLEYFREGGSEKHLRDIRGMLAVSGERINRAWLEAKIEELGLGAEWKTMKAEIK